LQTSVGQIIATALDTLSRRVSAKQAAIVATEALSQSHQTQRTPSITEGYNPAPVYRAPNSGVKNEAPDAYPGPDNHSLPPAHNPYPSPLGPNPPSYPIYTNEQPPPEQAYQASPYPQQAPYSSAPPGQLPIHPSLSTSQVGPLYVPANAVPYYTNAPASEWMRWSQATLSAFPQAVPPEYMTSTTANTLMALSGRSSSVQNGPSGTASHDPSSQWPANIFNIGQHGGNPAG
jgi:hypothetical protein